MGRTFTKIGTEFAEDFGRLDFSKLNDKGLGILISDHNVKATIDICENVKVISSGKIIADGSAAEITDNPLVKKVYLGESF